MSDLINCMNCHGSGLLRNQVECALCAGAGILPRRVADRASNPPKWIDDPHDIEKGQMLNPLWLEAQGITARTAAYTTSRRD